LRGTLLVFKHKQNKPFVEQFTEEIFIFVEQQLNEQQKAAFSKALLHYIFQVFKFKNQEFKAFIKKIPKMTGVVSGSLYDRLVKEKMAEGMDKERAETVTEEILDKLAGEMTKGMIEAAKRKREIIRGEYKFLVRTIRKMTSKKFDAVTIAELLEKSVEEIQKIQKELKKESKIIATLKKKQTIPAIAKKLKVSKWLVETIHEINQKKK